MSRARHKAMGGGTEPKPYDAAGSNVEKEAEEKKRGGRTKRKSGGKVEGDKAPKRMDRMPRKNGGRTGSGSDKNPLSSNGKTTPADGHATEVSGNAADGDEP